MANLHRLAGKLQTALLIKKGRKISINQFQAYSERKGRMVTKYVATELKEYEDGARKNVPFATSYQMADIVKKLAELLDGGDG